MEERIGLHSRMSAASPLAVLILIVMEERIGLAKNPGQVYLAPLS